MTTYPNTTAGPTALTTAAGTGYEQVTINPDGAGDAALLLVPTSATAGAAVKVVLYNHGWANDASQINSSVLVPTRDALLDRGWIVAAPNAHGNAWASQPAVDDSVRLAAYCAALWNVTDMLLLGGSMGGLTTLLLYGLNAIPKARACAAIDPAANLAWMAQNSQFATEIQTLYGASSAADAPGKVLGHDPCQLPAGSYGGKRLRLYASPTDTVVPQASNTDSFAARFAAEPVEITTVAVTGGHFTADHFRASDIVAFYDRALGVISAVSKTAPVQKWNGWTWVTCPVSKWDGYSWKPVTPLVSI